MHNVYVCMCANMAKPLFLLHITKLVCMHSLIVCVVCVCVCACSVHVVCV